MLRLREERPTMTKDLYFFPIIATALRKPDTRESLKAAIEEIKALGQRPEYRHGFLQFQRFMAEVKEQSEKPSVKPGDFVPEEIRYLSLQVASGLLEESPKETQATILDLIRSEPRWQEEFDKICREAAKSKMPPRIPEIIIEKNRETIGFISCEHPIIKEFRNVTSALYTARMDTGRIIWQGELTEKDLIWSAAFPGQALELAADTGEPTARMSREITLFDGELVIRVFPGAENGRLELRIKGSNLG
jgi:hypothetical protein